MCNCSTPKRDYWGSLITFFPTENDPPEIAVAWLFASARKNVANLSGYGAIPRCLQNVPSATQLLATAAEVQNLIVSGKRLEALQCAQEGQFWGFAFQLAADLGTQKWMAILYRYRQTNGSLNVGSWITFEDINPGHGKISRHLFW
ncbi:hypothetical protein IFM89_018444 [Coptis chinensis]|uniref:Sec16 Sec23-binding domain-containing protein n=1 Tax=Coptis chinensis TaxID=261450 RepID=A0A835HWR5_9MAGN|nr:hypothetical protein IFM89_018444 [Coptis chinensis]